MLLRLGAPPERVGHQRVRGLLPRAEPARRYLVDAGSEWRQRCSSLRQQHINVSHCAQAWRFESRSSARAASGSCVGPSEKPAPGPPPWESAFANTKVTKERTSVRASGAHAISARCPAAANHADGAKAALSVPAAAAPTRPARPDRRPRRALPGKPTGRCCVAYPHRVVCSGGRRSFGRHLPREDPL